MEHTHFKPNDGQNKTACLIIYVVISRWNI